MSRTISELKSEAEGLGISYDPKVSVDELKDLLARAIWERDYPNQPYPLQVKVMLGRDASKLSREEFSAMFNSRNWVAELKLNGCRGVLILGGPTGQIHMNSRRRSDLHHRYEDNIENVPQFKNFKWNFQGLTILDGELEHHLNSIETVDGTITKDRLQTSTAMLNSAPEKGIAMQLKYGNLKYVVFDAQFIDGQDLRNSPFYIRRQAVENFVSKQNHPDLQVSDQYKYGQENGVADFYAIYEKLVLEGQEGIMMKNLHGKYVTTGRPKDMWKMKKFVIYDGFITGFVPSTEDKGFEGYIGAFEVSSYIDGNLQVIGAVSSIDLETRKQATKYSDLSGQIFDENRSGNWKPCLNPEFLNRCLSVKGQEVTKNGRLFHCQLVEWRPDKNPEDCQILGSLYYGKA